MYKKDLERYLKETIASKGLKFYDEIFQRSKGAFPDIVYSLIKDGSLKERVVQNPIMDLPETVDVEPNPSNYDWRFDHSTITKIVDYIEEKGFSRVGLFGTPSLFKPLERVTQNIVLFDINEPLKEFFENDPRVSIVDINVMDFSDVKVFDCIVMDPPWYLNYYKTWLSQGSRLLKSNGEILITLFQEFLRPAAKQELKSISEFVAKFGEKIIYPDFIGYTTPLYEQEIFTHQGIPCHSNWRIADLAIIKKVDTNVKLRAGNFLTPKWVRFELNNQVIAMKKNRLYGEVKVEFPYDNNDPLLKSVSDRDPIRKKINFLTSRNRGLTIYGSKKVTGVLESIANGNTMSTAVANAKLKPAEVEEVAKILDIIFA